MASRKKNSAQSLPDGHVLEDNIIDEEDARGSRLSLFDDSVENHFCVIDQLYDICGESISVSCQEDEFEHLSNSVTFLREWRHFSYRPRKIRFSSETQSTSRAALDEISLPQFASAQIPKSEFSSNEAMSTPSRNDFVFYVGGAVWALDWCPRQDRGPDITQTCEFIAISAHPPDSAYHKLGVPLSGRGMVQIWCILNYKDSNEDIPVLTIKCRSKVKKDVDKKKDDSQPKRPRGRPRKHSINTTSSQPDCEEQRDNALAVEYPQSHLNVSVLTSEPSSELRKDVGKKTGDSQPKGSKGRPKKNPLYTTSSQPDCKEHSAFATADSQNPNNVPILTSKPESELKKDVGKKTDDSRPKRPRGQQKKNPVNTKSSQPSCDEECDRVFAIEYPQSSLNVTMSTSKPGSELKKDVGMKTNDSQPKRPRGRQRKHSINTASSQPDCEEQHDNALEYPQSPLNVSVSTNELKKDAGKKTDDSQPTRARSRLKKNQVNTTSIQPDCKEQCDRVSAIEYPQRPLNVTVLTSKAGSELKKDAGKKADYSQPKSPRGRWKKNQVKSISGRPDSEEQGVGAFAIEHQLVPSNVSSFVNEQNFPVPTEVNDESGKTRLTNGCKDQVKRPRDQPIMKPASPGCDSQNHDYQSIGTQASSSPPVVPLLPKVVLCIGHDAKVAWDVKWRPCGDSYSECNERLGYVAVVLGNGSLEVWEIPSPKIMKRIYLSQTQDDTDPRFVKLKPVFRCAMLKCGDRQSMPMTVEWSPSSPHNLILAGCHDGMVALWKFSVSDSSKDSRPLLFFSADTVPIRALTWAPSESDPDSANVIVTAGHEGMKFWDIRDPFHPLWDISAQRFIYSIDWLPDPRCVLTSYDDGTLRILSLSKAANDAPVTGKPYSGTQQQGLHSYVCSSFAIWSVHVSRHTGLVAYCGADGTIRYFQLTHKAVDKDPARNRAPHFMCGSLSEEDGNITVNIASANAPCPMKRSINEWGNTPKSLRGFVNSSNQARRAQESAATKKQKLDNSRALVVCDDKKPGSDDDLDLPLSIMLKNTKARKMKPKKKSKKNDQGTTNEGEVIENKKKPPNDQDGEVSAEFEVMPSKMVAVHRVRWNMNKGSERWLCYGGASGIVRCQEIIPPVFDKKALIAWRS